MIRFYNGRVLSFTEGTKITEDEVWVDGNKIAYVGKKREDAPAFEREIDLRGDLLMPGFKNAHTHSAMTFLRSLADDMPLDSWLSQKVWPNEAKLSPDMLYVMTKLAIMEYLTSGITSSFDMYMHNEAYVKANIDCGYRTVICSSMNNFDRDITNIEREYLSYNNCHELISYQLGFHAEYTTSMERMEYMAGLIQKYKAPMFVHLAETKAEVEGCVGRYGVTPAVLMEKMGMYDYGGGGFHCVWMSDEDIEIFKRRKLWAVLNPASNLKLSSDGGNPLFTKICKRNDALLESSCYGSAEITAANLGGAIDDDIIALHWTNMTAYSTFAARVFRILENGTVLYGEITSVTLTDGSQLLPIE